MKVSMSPRLKEYVKQQVAEGYYDNPDEVIHAALTDLIAREDSAIISQVSSGIHDIAEAVLVTLATSTKDMDDDIRMIMAEIKAMNEAKQKLREMIKDLNNWISNEMDRHPCCGEINNEKVTGEPEPSLTANSVAQSGSQTQAVGEGNPVAQSNPRQAVLDANVEGGTSFIPDRPRGGGIEGMVNFRTILEGLNAALDGMNEMSEMTSLRLQMLMDRRSKFISTLSNIMKKVSSTQDMLVQNLK